MTQEAQSPQDARGRFAVVHRPEEHRYVLVDRGEGDGLGIDADGVVIGEESYVDLTPEDGGPVQRVLHHTEVSDDYTGRGLASQLVRAVVDDVVASGLAIVPVCPYVAAWLPKHPEYAAHVVPPTTAHLRAMREAR